MIVNLLPTTLSLSFAIEPTLQAAALRMSDSEFCAMTEQVCDHLLAGKHEQLEWLLRGNQIEYSREVIHQIGMGRLMFFGVEIANAMQTVEHGNPDLVDAEMGDMAPSTFLRGVHAAVVMAVAGGYIPLSQELYEAGLLALESQSRRVRGGRGSY